MDYHLGFLVISGIITISESSIFKNFPQATSASEGLTKLLQERRRELPFTFRWLDIRRFSVNGDPFDDVVIN